MEEAPGQASSHASCLIQAELHVYSKAPLLWHACAMSLTSLCMTSPPASRPSRGIVRLLSSSTPSCVPFRLPLHVTFSRRRPRSGAPGTSPAPQGLNSCHQTKPSEPRGRGTRHEDFSLPHYSRAIPLPLQLRCSGSSRSVAMVGTRPRKNQSENFLVLEYSFTRRVASSGAHSC